MLLDKRLLFKRLFCTNDVFNIVTKYSAQNILVSVIKNKYQLNSNISLSTCWRLKVKGQGSCGVVVVKGQFCRVLSSPLMSLQEQVSESTTKTVLEKLLPDTRYTITVVPVYAEGDGPSLTDGGKTSECLWLLAVWSLRFYLSSSASMNLEKHLSLQEVLQINGALPFRVFLKNSCIQPFS